MTNKTTISSYFILITLLLGQSDYAHSDAIARNFFRKSTRELNQILPSTNPYTNISNVEYQQMRTVLNALDEIDSVLAEFLTTLPTNVFNKVDALPLDKKYAFMFDFDGRVVAINELEIDISLIDVWENIEHLQTHRKSIIFLKSHKIVNSSNGLISHIKHGELNPTVGTNVNTISPKKTFIDNGFSNRIKHETTGIHTLRPPIPNDIIIVNINKGPNSEGYYSAIVRKKVGNGWQNPNETNLTLKEFASAKESTCFPNAWDFKRIQEECSLALVLKNNPKLQNTGNTIFTSLLSDGNVCKIILDTSGKVVSFYPVIKFVN